MLAFQVTALTAPEEQLCPPKPATSGTFPTATTGIRGGPRRIVHPENRIHFMNAVCSPVPRVTLRDKVCGPEAELRAHQLQRDVCNYQLDWVFRVLDGLWTGRRPVTCLSHHAQTFQSRSVLFGGLLVDCAGVRVQVLHHSPP